MPVDVRTSRNKAGGGQVVETYDDGRNFQIVDGHLIVTGWDRAATSVAVYAPGQWMSAKVFEKK